MKTGKFPPTNATLKRVGRKDVRARACHPRTSSQRVLYLKNSATTIKHLLQPFQKLEKRYGRNLHGFSADIENFLKRLQGVIDFLDRENEISTRPDVFASVIDFLLQVAGVALRRNGCQSTLSTSAASASKPAATGHRPSPPGAASNGKFDDPHLLGACRLVFCTSARHALG